MNAVGIDVSKGKSTVAIMRPFGEVVAEPFEVLHSDTELRKLACFLEKLPGETKDCHGVHRELLATYRQCVARCRHFCLYRKCTVNLQIRQQLDPEG